MNWNYSFYSDLEDPSDTEAEFKSTSPTVAEESSGDSSTSSSDETDSAGERLEADVEEAALVLSYLRKVTPEIGRQFQVS